MRRARTRSHAQLKRHGFFRTTRAATWMLAATLSWSAVGCRNPNTGVQFELLHQEMRQMEDYIYHLENELEAKCQTLARWDGAQPDGQVINVRPDGESDETVDDELRIPLVTIIPEMDDIPDQQDNLETDDSAGTGRLPAIELPATAEPVAFPSPASAEDRSAAADSEDRQTPRTQNQVDAQVTHVVLNQRLTRGLNSDGAPGDDGLTIVLEPRNADGRFVPLPGPIAIVLLDPQKTGDQARVARWDIGQVEVERSLFVSGPDRGIHLDLTWPQGHPGNSRLHLFARYKTVDGRRLDVDQPISITRPGELSNRWTPSTRFSRRRQPSVDASRRLVDDSYGRKMGENSEARPSLPVIVLNDAATPAPDTSRPPSPPTAIQGPTRRIEKTASQLERAPRWRPYR